jgi:hypothetical protein
MLPGNILVSRGVAPEPGPRDLVSAPLEKPCPFQSLETQNKESIRRLPRLNDLAGDKLARDYLESSQSKNALISHQFPSIPSNEISSRDSYS